MAYDLIIKNGCVVDGSGEPAFHADVAVHQGKIVGVGKYNGAAATRTIDAAGRVVAPGFIDHHTHFDPQAVWDPYCGSSVQNGHTTIVVGQCGHGGAYSTDMSIDPQHGLVEAIEEKAEPDVTLFPRRDLGGFENAAIQPVFAGGDI